MGPMFQFNCIKDFLLKTKKTLDTQIYTDKLYYKKIIDRN